MVMFGIEFLFLSTCWLATQNAFIASQETMDHSPLNIVEDDPFSNQDTKRIPTGMKETQVLEEESPEDIPKGLDVQKPKPGRQQGRHYVENVSGFYPPSGSGYGQGGGYNPNYPVSHNSFSNYPSGQYPFGQYNLGQYPSGHYHPGQFPLGRPFGQYPSPSFGYTDRYDVYSSRQNSAGRNGPSAINKFHPH